jgi:O-antigen/teichoic acid export membrane protein
MSSRQSKSLTVSTSWLMFAKTLGFAFTIAIPLLLVRQLSQHEFGLYKQVFLVIGTTVSMLPLGFGMSAFYFLPRDENRRRETVLNVVLFTGTLGALGAAMLALFPSLLLVLFKDAALVPYAPWIGLVIFLMVTGSFLEIVTVANDDMKVATLAILAVQVTRAAFFLIAAMTAGTIGALILAAIAQGLVQIAVLLAYLNSRFPRFWTALDYPTFRAQLTYSLPLGVAGLIYTLQIDLHNYFISNRFSAAAFAVYSIGCFQLPLIGILSESVGSVLIPRVSYLQHTCQTREIVLLTSRVVRKLAAVYFPLYVFLMVTRREFITGLFTTRYVDSIPIFAINLTLIPLSILLVDPIIRAYAQHRHFVLKLQVILLGLLAVALWFGVERFGPIGAIIIVVTFNGLLRVVLLIKVIRILGMQAHDIVLFSDLAKIGVAAVSAGAATLAARSFNAGGSPLTTLFVCAVVFAMAYGIAILVLRVPTTKERDVVATKLRTLFGPRRSPAMT